MTAQAYRAFFSKEDPFRYKTVDFKSSAQDVETLKQEAWSLCYLHGQKEDWKFQAKPLRFLTVQDVLDSPDLKDDNERDLLDTLVGDILNICDGPPTKVCSQFGLSMRTMDFSEDQSSYSVLYLRGTPIALRVSDFEGELNETYDISPPLLQELLDFIALWKRSNTPAPEPARDPSTILLCNRFA